jgi:hypothetical protein
MKSDGLFDDHDILEQMDSSIVPHSQSGDIVIARVVMYEEIGIQSINITIQ